MSGSTCRKRIAPVRLWMRSVQPWTCLFVAFVYVEVLCQLMFALLHRKVRAGHQDVCEESLILVHMDAVVELRSHHLAANRSQANAQPGGRQIVHLKCDKSVNRLKRVRCRSLRCQHMCKNENVNMPNRNESRLGQPACWQA